MVIGVSLDRGCIMASWGSFAWGFFAGLLVGEMTLGFFLALVRQGRGVEIVESPPLATPTPATSDSAAHAHSLT
jgi:hypothetical protein